MSVKSWCGTCMEFTFGCTHAEAPVISTGAVIDDDGDALRLYVEIFAKLDFSRAQDIALALFRGDLAATKRAIVESAAWLAKSMPATKEDGKE